MRKILCLNTENESENKIQVKQYSKKAQYKDCAHINVWFRNMHTYFVTVTAAKRC